MKSKMIIPVELQKKASKLDKITLLEVVDVNCLTELINSNVLEEEEFNTSKYTQQLASQLYSNVKDQLIAYSRLYNKKIGAFKVPYHKPSRHKYGRVFPKKSLGLTSFSKKIRNTLLSNKYIDIDIHNAQPSILWNICNSNNIECPNLTYYINNREKVLEDIIKEYGVCRKKAKKLILSLGFLGSFRSWAADNNLKNKKSLPFITKISREFKNISEKIKIENPSLYDTARRLKNNKNKNKNILGSFFSLYLQEYETRILECVIDWLSLKTNIMNFKNTNLKVGTYEFDGIKLLKENVDKYGLDNLTNDLHHIVYDKLGFDIVFEEKPIEGGYDINYIPYVEEKDDTDTNWENGVSNDLQASEKLFQLYPHWVCCQDVLYVFDDNTGMWKSKKNAYLSVIKKFSDDLRIVATIHGDKILTDKSYGNTLSLMERLPTLIKSSCVNDDWLKQKECSSLGRLLFNNGYIDVSNGKFMFYDKETYGFNPDIVFMGKIDKDFEPMNDEQLEYMNDIKQRLFYNSLGQDVGDYYILNIARALMGDMMKRVLFGLGNTDCGKTILTKAIEYSLGDYVGSFNAENLLYRKSSNDEAQVMRWALLLRYKRIIISNEMKSTSTINGNMLKKVSSGGDSLTGRVHCGNETSFTPHFLTMCLANDLPPISPYDNAVDNRVRVISYKKQFVDVVEDKENELPKDYNLINELKTTEFQFAFLMMLIQSYVNYKENGEPEEPEDVVNGKKEWIDDTCNEIDKFKEAFVITNNEDDFIESKMIKEWLKEEKVGISSKKMGMEIMKYCKKKDFNNVETVVKWHEGRSCRGWKGIKEPLL